MNIKRPKHTRQATRTTAKPTHNSNTVTVGNIHGTGIAIGHGAKAEVHHHIALQKVLPQPRFSVPFHRNMHFVGRGSELAELHSILKTSELVGQRIVVIHGLGGIGKTELAVEYAYRFRNAYPGGIYWINASQYVENELVAQAASTGLLAKGSGDVQRRRQVILAFRDFLDAHPDALLIFDNIKDPHLLQESILGFVPAEIKCGLLCTTRFRGREPWFHQTELGGLPDDLSGQLLLQYRAANKKTLSKTEIEDAQSICRLLGNLPLAISIVAQHLDQRPKQTLLIYRRSLEEKGLLRTLGEASTSVHQGRVLSATLQSHWDILEANEARYVLQVAALFMGSNEVSRARLGLLIEPSHSSKSESDDNQLDHALGLLHQNSLITFEGDRIVLPPLIADYVRGTIQNRVALTRATARNMADHLLDPTRLNDQIGQRRVDAVLDDLEICINRLDHTDDQGIRGNLETLRRILRLEAQNLRNWDPVLQPTLCLQQLRNRVQELECNDWLARFDSSLARLRRPYLIETRRASKESRALVCTMSGDQKSLWWFDKVIVMPDATRVISAESILAQSPKRRANYGSGSCRLANHCTQ